MSTLTRRKENFNRSNPSKTLLKDVQVSAIRNNLTGEITITINSNCNDGENKYRLTLSGKIANQIAWLFEKEMMK